MTPSGLVETKLYRPLPRGGLVSRPRLDRLLQQGQPRLTLVSAPAGFGKTTLLAQWLSAVEGTGVRVGWVSLDQDDREPGAFWAYVLTALERAVPAAGSAGLDLLGAGQPPQVALTAALNELSVRPEEVLLVLDDYHLADSPDVAAGVAFLLKRLPPQVRLVLSTRADPVLPLARLRVAGDLCEVRAADLRFTDSEAARFLADATGYDLAAADVATLGARTEGWVASLQLAALSLRGRSDPTAFIAGFAGDDRYVVDYLVSEVLDVQIPAVREFLLSTAVLEGLNGSLCDAVTGTDSGSGELLETLERANLFVVALDDQRRWFRYHHLFADVLRAHLARERPADLPVLHRRASSWYARAGRPQEAVRHALAAGDVDAAADLAERAVPDLRRERREQVLAHWVHLLPESAVRGRPVLAVGLVGGLMASNDFAHAAPLLDDVEQVMLRPADQLEAIDPDQVLRLPAALATYRAALALVRGDLAGTASHAARAQALSVEGDDLTRAAATGLAGLAAWTRGDIAAAEQDYQATIEGLTRAGHVADVLGCSLTMADLQLTLGSLAGAERTLQDALDLAARQEQRGPVRGTADMLVALSRVAWHRDDLPAAAEQLRRAELVGETAGLPQHPYRWRVALARLRAAARDYPGALDLLHEAEQVYVGDMSPQVHPIHATRARVLTGAGDLDAARAWARQHRVHHDDELSYLREYEHLTLAKLLLAQRTPASVAQAGGLLARLLDVAKAGGRTGTVIEVQVLRAVGHAAADDRNAALEAMRHAVDLAEPDGWVRVFVDAGPRVPPLLRDLPPRTGGAAFVGRLVAATTAGGAGQDAVPTPGPTLVDPLSERERQVLQLLASDLDGPGIAAQLVVSLNTVRTHTKHIYTKLDVTNRRAAVTRAHQLGLLSRSGG